MGAGRTELFDCIMGREPLASGRVTLAGQELSDRSIHGRIKRGIALIPEDLQGGRPRCRSCRFREHVDVEPVVITRLFHLDVKRERSSVRDFVKAPRGEGIEASTTRCRRSSGGEPAEDRDRQGADDGPKVLLMDEPSRGIDIGAKAESSA